MNWITYWESKRIDQPKLSMKTNPKYLQYLQDKNLAPSTIRSYLDTLQQFPSKLNTENVKAYFKSNLKIMLPLASKSKNMLWILMSSLRNSKSNEKRLPG